GGGRGCRGPHSRDRGEGFGARQREIEDHWRIGQRQIRRDGLGPFARPQRAAIAAHVAEEGRHAWRQCTWLHATAEAEEGVVSFLEGRVVMRSDLPVAGHQLSPTFRAKYRAHQNSFNASDRHHSTWQFPPTMIGRSAWPTTTRT